METPVVIVLFRRPSMTRNLINILRKVKPKEVFVIADGPSTDKDRILCQSTRNEVNSIDWDCKIHKKYADKNLGLRRNIAGGLKWVFSKVDEAIVLEDDLIPEISFFQYCESLLKKYRNNRNIISISGNCFLKDKSIVKDSYYFSRYVHSWGWATWKRAWDMYDDKMIEWPKRRNSNWLRQVFGNKVIEIYWRIIFDKVYTGKIDSWAYRWTYTSLLNNCLTIIPAVNLVTNVGYDNHATHTKVKNSTLDLSTRSIHFPLKHPQHIKRNELADSITEKNAYKIELTRVILQIIRYKLAI